MAIDLKPTAPIAPSPLSSATSGQVLDSAHSFETVLTGSRWGWILLTLIVLGGVGAYFSLRPVVSQLIPQVTHKIIQQDLNVSVTEEGTLESANNVEIRCRVRGANTTIVYIVDNGVEVQPGDVLVRFDTKTIEDTINTQQIAYQNAAAAFAQSETDVAIAKINITEYLEGTYRSERMTKEKDLAVAKANLVSAENLAKHGEAMFRKGYVSKLEVESNNYALEQAQLDLGVKETDLDVLNRYTKAKKIQELEGILKAKEAKLASDAAAAALEKSKLEREQEQLKNCVITAERGGMVVYAGSEQCEDKPDIREGATVREDQRLLLMPDLSQMQVKFGIHEAKIEQVKIGMPCRIQIQDRSYDGKLKSIASVAKPGGWWNGNMVKYDSIIAIDSAAGLKPGMSSKAEVILARHQSVVAIPVGAVVENEENFFCWTLVGKTIERKKLLLGDTDDQFMVVLDGVKEGDEVVINPLAYVDEAEKEALKPYRRNTVKKPNESKSESPIDKENPDSSSANSTSSTADSQSAPTPGTAQIMNQDEVAESTGNSNAEKTRLSIGSSSSTWSGGVDRAELRSEFKHANVIRA
jgi:HlyD family secretion protein